MISGIYKITSLDNNKFYIGSSKEIKIRWNRHLNDLKNKKHGNIHLQRAFNKYGIDSFKFEIIEYCEEHNLLIREQYYLDTLKPYEDGFNIGVNSSGGDNLTNNPRREEIIENIKRSVNENISKMTDEEKKNKWSRGFGSDNPNYGNTWSEDSKIEASNFQKERVKNGLNAGSNRKGINNIELYGEDKAKEISLKLSKHASTRIGNKNPFFDKKHTSESKDKIRRSRIGKKPTNRVKISIYDIIYESYHDASKELKIPIVTIRWRCLSNNHKFEDYKLVG